MQNPLIRLFRGKVSEKERRTRILDKITHGEIKDITARPAIIIHIKAEGESPVYNLPIHREFFIGRDPKFFVGKDSRNQLYLEGEGVSDVHAKIRPEKDSYVLYDLASKSGTYVNWEKKLKHKLEHRDRIRIGPHILMFEFIEEGKGSFDGIERRKAVRIKPLITIKFLMMSHDKLKEYHGIVKDISIDGARIEIEQEMPEGNIIEAGISSSELAFVEFIAQVIWKKIKREDTKILYEMGIQFLKMDEKEREILKNYLFNSAGTVS